jgi:hypothetical protein
VLLTRTPLYFGLPHFTFDLHVLGTPPAFALSQDQTLMFNLLALQSLRSAELRASPQVITLGQSLLRVAAKLFVSPFAQCLF